jgi:hypothetical protein
MGNTRDTGYLQNIVQYDASNNITLPANLTVTGTITGYATTSYVGTQLAGYVPTTRTISINGTSLDLSANRSFTINSMVYPGVGIAVSTGSAWGTSLTDNSGNWNTAFGWGNHAGLYSLLNHTHTFASLTSKPTTLVGYGITDAATSAQGTSADTAFGWGNHSIAGYLTGITSGQVTTALGFTPYNATNPSNYITTAALSTYATQTYVGTQIANLVASSPAALDTLNELAAALGNDAAFSTTVSTALGNRLRVDTNAQGLNGTQQANGRTNLGLGTAATSNTGDFVAYRTFGTAANSATGDFVAYRTFGTAANNNTGDFAAASHTHSIANVTGLQTALDGKQASGSYAAATHSHIISDVTGLQTALDGKQAFLGFTPYNSTNPSGYISSYTETDTLASVTGRGASTSTNLSFTGNLSFGSSTRQMITLWGSVYGIGVQSGTQYYRADDNFAWFRDGVHSDTTFDPGSGGVLVMKLDSSSNLTVTGTIAASNFSGTHSGSSSGTNTGDQINISGNAATATNVAYSGLTGTIPTWNQNTTGTSSNITAYTINQNLGTANSPSFSAITATTVQASAATDAAGLYLRSALETLSGEGWCTALYNYNYNDGFLILNRDTSDVAHPVFHVGGWNNAGYGGWTNGDSMITLVRADGTKTTGSANAYKGLSNSSYYTNIVKTTARTEFKDSQGVHYFTGSISASNLSGTNTGDQTNISGTAEFANQLKWYGAGATPTNANTFQRGILSNYYGGGAISNVPEATYGSLYNFGGYDASSLALQLYSAVNHNSTSSTRTLFFRMGNNLGFQNDWKTLLDNTNYSSYALPTTGGTISGNLLLNTSGGTSPYFWLTTDQAAHYIKANSYWIDFVGNANEMFRWYNSTTLSMKIDGSNNLTVAGDVTAYSSDKRLKNNIKNIESGLQKVLSLNGVTFDWDQKAIDLGFTPTHRYNDSGVIAQEVEAVLPQAIRKAPFDDDGVGNSKSGENYLTVQYEKLVPLFIEAIKEQQTQIESQKSEIDELKDLVQQLINR